MVNSIHLVSYKQCNALARKAVATVHVQRRQEAGVNRLKPFNPKNHPIRLDALLFIVLQTRVRDEIHLFLLTQDSIYDFKPLLLLSDLSLRFWKIVTRWFRGSWFTT